ncbi:MAG: FadR family transcriptional regulator [Bacteroidetes bacterium]|nr:MAG: FadR family transcriptional regulator [Bacteroidota bacterium]
MEITDHLQKIALVKPADEVIRQLKQMLAEGLLQPGDRLPPERVLAERLQVGRGHVREALKKLEFYGILETRPQSGTYVARLGIQLIDNLIAHVIRLEADSLEALVETRQVLEVQVVRLAAQRLDAEARTGLEAAHAAFSAKVAAGEDGMEEDLLFHLRLAQASGNPVLANLLALIVPQIMYAARKHDLCAGPRPAEALREHAAILAAVRARDPEAAAAAMAQHLRHTLSQA